MSGAARDSDGIHSLDATDTFSHEALPDFTLDLGEIFAKP
jgi:hypothetical protein